MIDYHYNWFYELDDGRDRVDARAKCANCDRRVHPLTLSRDGLCEACLGRAKDDERELRAEAQRRP